LFLLRNIEISPLSIQINLGDLAMSLTLGSCELTGTLTVWDKEKPDWETSLASLYPKQKLGYLPLRVF
jgi:hypothetical protein